MHIELHPIQQDEPLSSNRDILAICEGTKQLYKYIGFNPPWIGYLAKLDNDVVGTCAFKSSPRDGRVEIAYCTLPQYEGKGIATKMAHRLVEIARAKDVNLTVFAQTAPSVGPASRVLQKLGFRSVGTVIDPHEGPVWEWVQPPLASAVQSQDERPETYAN